MENLITKLQDEVGLTEEQAIKSLKMVKEYMDQEGIEIDWDKFFKGKFEDFKSQSQSFFKNIMSKAHDYSNKIGDKVEDLTEQAKDKAHDLSQKAADYIDKNKKENQDNSNN